MGFLPITLFFKSKPCVDESSCMWGPELASGQWAALSREQLPACASGHGSHCTRSGFLPHCHREKCISKTAGETRQPGHGGSAQSMNMSGELSAFPPWLPVWCLSYQGPTWTPQVIACSREAGEEANSRNAPWLLGASGGHNPSQETTEEVRVLFQQHGDCPAILGPTLWELPAEPELNF